MATDAEILTTVKTMLFGTPAGTFRDALLTAYINEVKNFMLNAGVPIDVINSDATVGVIALGVGDLWNYQSGGVKLSEYFKQRVIQLTRSNGEQPTSTKTIFKEFKQYVKTTDEETTEIEVNIAEYDPETGDVINVFVNGMLEIVDVDYTLNDRTITFNIAKIPDTEIVVSVYKLVKVLNGGA